MQTSPEGGEGVWGKGRFLQVSVNDLKTFPRAKCVCVGGGGVGHGGGGE